MPYKDPDPNDPNVLVGVMLPADKETMQEMAYAFAEEFALLGYSSEELFSLFQNPFYAAAHQAYRALGDEATRKIIAECLAAWGGIKVNVQDVQSAQTDRTPSSILPRVAGEETDGGWNNWNDLNGLNTKEEETEDG